MRVAERHGLTIHFVSNAFMRLPEGPLIKRVVVSDGPDAADNWIAERAGKGTVTPATASPASTSGISATATATLATDVSSDRRRRLAVAVPSAAPCRTIRVSASIVEARAAAARRGTRSPPSLGSGCAGTAARRAFMNTTTSLIPPS